MFSTTSLTAFLFLAVSVAATPIVIRDPFVSLGIKKLLNLAGAKDIVKRDQAHAKGIISKGTAIETGIWLPGEVDSVSATNNAFGYVAEVAVGLPLTYYSLLIDTGSSNTWVGARKAYVKTITSEETGENVNVTYGSGSFNGIEFLDTVTLGSETVIFRQSIGAASNSSGFADSGFDGIIGIGPTDLTIHTLSPDRNALIPTVTDNLFSQGTIEADLVAISFAPTDTAPNLNGEMRFGSTDSSKFTGEITYIPRTKTSVSNKFWGIDQSITYGSSSTPILPTTAGIVDTGTTLILIATDAFERYKTATGAVLDEATGFLRITQAQYGNLQSLFFIAGGRSFELTANAQIWPRSLNTIIGGTNDYVYLVVNNLVGTSTGPVPTGIDFINGQCFLERFYSVYDSHTGNVGLATTPYTFATTN